jgi:hypothetical protein
MKIAHWHSQSLHRAEDLHYQNLLGACMGVTQRLQHCDTLQADRDIKFNPANPDHRIESRIRYLEDGSVVSDDEEFNEQLTLILGLNHTVFKQWRRNQLIDFQELLGEGTILREGWENELADWNGDSHTQDLEPYCQIVVDYIRKKLGR